MKPTTAQRQADVRARRALMGLQELRGLWLPPRLHDLVRQYAKRMNDDDQKRRGGQG